MSTVKTAERGRESRKRYETEMPDHFFPPHHSVGSTVGLTRDLEEEIYGGLDMQPGDIVALVSASGRRIEGHLLVKPKDCVLVDFDSLSVGHGREQPG